MIFIYFYEENDQLLFPNSLLSHPFPLEHKTDFCDFFENEEVIPESVDDLMKRINEFKELLKGLNNVLVIGHSDFFWYLTSNIVEIERCLVTLFVYRRMDC